MNSVLRHILRVYIMIWSPKPHTKSLVDATPPGKQFETVQVLSDHAKAGWSELSWVGILTYLAWQDNGKQNVVILPRFSGIRLAWCSDNIIYRMYPGFKVHAVKLSSRNKNDPEWKLHTKRLLNLIGYTVSLGKKKPGSSTGGTWSTRRNAASTGDSSKVRGITCSYWSLAYQNFTDLPWSHKSNLKPEMFGHNHAVWHQHYINTTANATNLWYCFGCTYFWTPLCDTLCCHLQHPPQPTRHQNSRWSPSAGGTASWRKQVVIKLWVIT